MADPATPAAPIAPAAAAAVPADLAAAAVAAFRSNAPAVAAQAAAAVTPTPAAPAAAAPAAGAAATTPATLLSETPVAATPAKETAAAVAAEAAKVDAPAYKLAVPESGRLTAEHVAQVEAFAKSHGMTEAQAKQVLARDDLNVATAFDANRDELLRDPTLGGPNIDTTIATTKRVLGALFTPDERKLIASLPIANSRLLHQFCAKVAALMPVEDIARSPTPGQAERQVSVGQAMYPHMYQK